MSCNLHEPDYNLDKQEGQSAPESLTCTSHISLCDLQRGPFLAPGVIFEHIGSDPLGDVTYKISRF